MHFLNWGVIAGINLREKLDRLVADEFPAKSSEYAVGSPKHNEYISALNKVRDKQYQPGSFKLIYRRLFQANMRVVFKL